MNKQSSTIKQVLALQNQPIQELKKIWVQLFDEPAPPYQKNYLLPRLAHRLQELAYGPMTEKPAATLESLANQMVKGKKFSNHMLNGKPAVGTKLIREYQGVAYEVLVAENGFTYCGQTYKSLSAIARRITGTRWNGPLFFGLRNRGAA